MNKAFKELSMADIAIDNNGIVDGPFGSNLKKSDYIDDSQNGIPVLTTKNLYGDYSSDSVRYISKEKYETLKRSTVFPGDIIVAKIGSIGKCGIYPLDQGLALIPANLLKITVRAEISRKYVFYYIQSRRFQDMIKSISTATAQPAFNVTKFRKLPIPVPPLEDQHRIVTRIEELFSQLDSGVETLKKTKEQLKVYRQAVLKEAFESASSSNSKNLTINDLLTKKKKGMTTGPFGTMLKKHEHQSSGVPVLGIENIGKDGFVDGNKIFVSEEKAKELSAFKVDTDDLIISRSGTVGEICIVPPHMKNALLSTNLMRISLDFDVIRADYFMYLFKSKGVVIDQVKELCKGSTRMFLNQTILKQIIFPVPTLKIQAKIIETIESRLSVCDSIEKTIDTALQEAEALRQSILKQAFEGGL